MTYTFTPIAGTDIGKAVESAIKMALATGKNVIIQMNEARFCVNAKTKKEDAIKAYHEVRNKIIETKKKLNENVK